MAAQASDESRYLSGVGPKRLNGSLDGPVKGTSLYKTSGMEGAGMRALCLYFVWDEGRCPQVYEGDAGSSRGTLVPCCIPEASGTHPGALGGLPRAVEVFQSVFSVHPLLWFWKWVPQFHSHHHGSFSVHVIGRKGV